MDDILAFGQSFEHAFDNLKCVFDRIRKSKLLLNPLKCALFHTEMEFLGSHIDRNGITPSKSRIEAVECWPTPKNVKELQSFLGTVGYYRQHIKDYANYATPLYELCKKNSLWKWNEHRDNCFQYLKNSLKNDTLLAYPTTTGRFILATDASDYGAGAVLCQEQADMDGKLRERPIAYYSKGFNTAERNYCTTKRELLAIVYAVKKFRPYIFGRPFIIRTDHCSLQHLLNFKEAEGILARWITQLQEFDFKINYRSGKEM